MREGREEDGAFGELGGGGGCGGAGDGGAATLLCVVSESPSK